MIMGNVPRVCVPPLGKKWEDIFFCVPLPVPFSLALEIHGIISLRLLAEYHTLNSWG